MSQKFFDREIFSCAGCGHRWILSSNKMITDEQHNKWDKEIRKEHLKIVEREQ